ncbi:MAG TPA: glycine cleavage T C-terminal barrel domain-containing protein [Acidimicrobiales bacterium]|nr:glycine cleavage T C-terminal barrel domain-containing protein [Acidimicrobiales bacterium]
MTSADSFDQDYEALRHTVGAVALGRDVLRVSGPDAVEYLQGQLSQDVAALDVGESADSLILTPQGKLDALVRVSRHAADELIVDVDAGFGDAVVARMERFKLRVKAVIERLDWHAVALRGPGAATLATTGGASGDTVLALRFSWNGVEGIDLLGPAPEVPEGVRACSVEAWESVRVEAGIPVMGAELDERTIAAEVDLLERSVSFTKGCYTGQELVARLDARGNRVARHLRGLVVAGPAPRPATVSPGSDIVLDGKVVGSVTSTAWSPALGCPVALGYVHRAVPVPGAVDIRPSRPGGADDADGADDGTTSALRAEVRTLPLV